MFFKCKFCGKVNNLEFQSLKSNLCKSCYMKLEELYSSLGIHEYIRDNGFSEDFDVNHLAAELKLNPSTVRMLFDMGFFERDIQVYGNNKRRKKLAEKFEHELEKFKHTKNNDEQPIKKITKLTTYGGKIYERGKNSGRF